MLELKKQKIERQILWSDRLCIPISKAGTVGSILLKANPSMFLTREMLVPRPRRGPLALSCFSLRKVQFQGVRCLYRFIIPDFVSDYLLYNASDKAAHTSNTATQHKRPDCAHHHHYCTTDK